MTDLITRIKQIIEDEARIKFKPEYHQSSYDENSAPRAAFIDCAEFLLPLIDVLVRQRNYFMDGLFKDVDTEIARRERLNQELLSILKGGE